VSGAARPPILVLVLGAAFLLLMASLLIGSLTKPEFPSYAVTLPEPVAVGDSLVGPVTYTLDASSADRWRYFDFSRNATVESPGPGEWDLAFRRFHVRAAEPGGIVDLGAVPFDSVQELPSTSYVSGVDADSSSPAVGKWYDYSWVTHLLTSKRHVYAMRTRDGRYAKLQILAYYCQAVGAACPTVHYAYQGDRSRRVARAPKQRRP